MTTGSDPENVGCCNQQRVDVVGNPDKGPGVHTQQKWFNPDAFAQQAPYTYGNEKVNPSGPQHWNNVDMSLFRQFST